MLTLKHRWGWSIYSLRAKRCTWASDLTLFADREGWMSGRPAGCPVAREGPDVRAGEGGRSALWMGSIGCPGGGAGCLVLQEVLDVRGDGWMFGLMGQPSVLPGRRGRMSGQLAEFLVRGTGCPGPVASAE